MDFFRFSRKLIVKSGCKKAGINQDVDFPNRGCLFDSLAAFASEDESAAVAADFFVGVEDFVDATVSSAILERVKKGH